VVGVAPVLALGSSGRPRGTVVVYRVVRAKDIVLGGELDAIARERGLTLHYVVGDHRTAEDREHLSPAHLRELVPDIADRDVHVCGPPGLTDVLERNVRAAGVPKRFIHAERFAL
jgi:ferredoxin-NADP reductase